MGGGAREAFRKSPREPGGGGKGDASTLHGCIAHDQQASAQNDIFLAEKYSAQFDGEGVKVAFFTLGAIVGIDLRSGMRTRKFSAT